MDSTEMIRRAGPRACAEALAPFLAAYLSPSFGSLPKREVDQCVLDVLVALGALPAEPSPQDLVGLLRVTRQRARTLVYARELRLADPARLEQRLVEVLAQPVIQKDGEEFVLDVDSPLLLDHLRARVRALGFVAEGGFSPSLVRLPLAAMVALVREAIPEDRRDEVLAALRAAGLPDTSLAGVLRAALRRLGQRVASEAGAMAMDEVSGYLKPLLEANLDRIKRRFTALLKQSPD